MREVVSRVQRMRKEAGLAVSDRITLWVSGHADVERSVQEHSGHIGAEVLARSVNIGAELPAHTNAMQTAEIDGLAVAIAIRKE